MIKKGTDSQLDSNIQLVLDRLRSGKDKQGVGMLGSAKDGRCCLMVMALALKRSRKIDPKAPLLSECATGKGVLTDLGLESSTDFWSSTDENNLAPSTKHPISTSRPTRC